MRRHAISSDGYHSSDERPDLIDHSSPRLLSMPVRPLILCGGFGARLWPLSTELVPKQLMSLVGTDTLLQATLRRVPPELFESPVIVTRECFAPLVAEQLTAMGVEPAKVLLEPIARDTAPAIAAAAFSELTEHRDPLLLSMPSDHVIRDMEAFTQAVRTAIPVADLGHIVTFGIRPTRAETGYGYMEVRPEEHHGATKAVARFTEKPDAITAASYVESGVHFWNAGIFLFRASTLIDELKEYAPEVASACEKAVTSSVADGNRLLMSAEHFASSPSISIDYAVFEKSKRISMIEVDMGWSDIGSWEALWDLGNKDSADNVVFGNVQLLDSRGCLVRNELSVPLAVADARDLVVVATASGTLVMPRASAQKAKLLKEALTQKKKKKKE